MNKKPPLSLLLTLLFALLLVSSAEQALNCLDCHGDSGRLDWQQLGYQGDPMKSGKTR